MRIPPDVYKRMALQHTRLKTMKQGQFVQWACRFWQEAYDEGFAEAEQKYTQHGVNVSEDVEAEVWDEDDLLTLDDVRSAMLSVKGIGSRRADAAIKILLKRMEENEGCIPMAGAEKTGREKAI